jgi:hypothetical protein
LRLSCHVTMEICKYENTKKMLGPKECEDPRDSKIMRNE